MRLYIAGPMTGYEAYNKVEFEYAAQALRESGHEPVSPVEMDGDLTDQQRKEIGWQDYLGRDLKVLIDCEGVVALEGWEASKGATFEIDTARRLGKPVYQMMWNGLTKYVLVEMEEKETILEEAQRIVTGDRGADYGHPVDDFGRTAKMWSAILDRKITAAQVALCMTALKISREVNRPKRDNRVDAAGYLLTLDMVVEKGKSMLVNYDEEEYA